VTRSHRLMVIFFLIATVAAFVFIINGTPIGEDVGRDALSSSTQNPPAVPNESRPQDEPGRSANVVSARSTPSNTPSSAVPSSHEAVLDVLEKYSGTREWWLDEDHNGRIFKMTGGKLKGVMTERATNAAFLNDLRDALGLTEPSDFTFETQSTSSFRTVEQKQILILPDGSTLPVFEGKIRYIGDGEGNAFLIYNELRPIRMNFRWEVALDTGELLSIARAHVRDPDGARFLVTGASYAFSHAEPHQKVSEVVVENGGFRRRLLIGHETKSVVWDRPMTVR